MKFICIKRKELMNIYIHGHFLKRLQKINLEIDIYETEKSWKIYNVPL